MLGHVRAALIALVVPLCFDTFGVSAALGLGGLAPQRRLRTATLFAIFETAMPLVGLAIGRPLGETIGNAAGYLAIALLTALALYMLFADDDETRVLGFAERPGIAAIPLGLSVSLDELAIGFTLGLLRAPVVPLVILIGVQAFIASQLGLRLGARLGKRAQERAESIAGVALLTLAGALLAIKLAHA